MIRSIPLRTLRQFSFLMVTLLLLLQTGDAQQRTKEFTIEDTYASTKFAGKGIRGLQWINGGKAYSYLETDTSKKQTDIWTYDVSSGKKMKLVDAGKLILKEGDKPFTIQNYFWYPDDKNILFTGTVSARSLKTGAFARGIWRE